MAKQRKLFCERNALFFEISQKKGILLRRLSDLRSSDRFAVTRSDQPLPQTAAERETHLIKRAPGVDLTLQENKAVNIRLASERLNGLLIRPGETFSFWRTIGRTTKAKGYLDGRVIEHGKLVPGTGGGLCNLGNTLHLLVLHSPLTVTEFHHHSDALAPDEGPRVPFSAGTSVCYNYIDYRFRNDTDQTFQLWLRVEGENLHAALRCERPLDVRYELAEEDHHFQREGDKYYRVSKIYRLTTDAASGELREKKLILDNHSEVMFDPALIPADLLRD